MQVNQLNRVPEAKKICCTKNHRALTMRIEDFVMHLSQVRGRLFINWGKAKSR